MNSVLIFFLIAICFRTLINREDVVAEEVNPSLPERRILLEEENYYTLVDAVHKLQAEVASLKNDQAKRSSSSVAYKAHLTTSLPPLGLKQLIDFNEAQFNNGRACHGGTFIAPVNGSYLFSVCICSPSGHFIVVDPMKNAVTQLGVLTAGDAAYTECSSQTVITEFRAGDDVNVHHDTSQGGVLGDTLHMNTFTGVLLNEA